MSLIQVLARDGGFPISNNGTATLLVYIEDTNDNRPIFNPGLDIFSDLPIPYLRHLSFFSFI